MKKLLLTSLIAFIIAGCGGSGSGESTPMGNQPPTVFAGHDRTIRVGETVTLDGSNCSDSDGDPLTFDWHFVSLPQGSTATLTDATATLPDFSADLAGEYIIELSLSDGMAVATDAVIITATTGQPGLDCTSIVPGANIADDFTCAHNTVRESAQPVPVPPLPPMTWDPALAQIAQDYAETCTWAHNPHRSGTYPGYVGENLYITTWPDSTPETAVQSWADEAQFYDYATDTCQSGEDCGHYTQVVWRDSIKVGCAKVFCPSVANLGWTDADFYVCNYAPGGNNDDEKPY